MSETAAFRDLTGLSKFLKGSLAVYVALAVVAVWSGWLEIDLFQRVASGVEVPDAEAAASDARQAVVGLLQFVTYLVTGIAFLRWTYLTKRNARTLGATDLDFTPGWAVGWYFVPIATLWKPYQALKETFKASHPEFGDAWRDAPRPGLMPLWWTLWIISGTFSQAAFRLSSWAETVEALLATSWITLVSDAIDIPLGLVVIVLVSELHSWQEAKQERMVSAAT